MLGFVEKLHVPGLATNEQGKEVCRKRKRRLCSFVEICTNEAEPFDGITGDQWVPVIDGDNQWVYIGMYLALRTFQHLNPFLWPIFVDLFYRSQFTAHLKEKKTLIYKISAIFMYVIKLSQQQLPMIGWIYVSN